MGFVPWIRVPFGPSAKSLARSIGIKILATFRRQHYGSTAQPTLAQQLIARSEANRVQADTDPENITEQRALLRADSTREGVAR